MPVLRTLPALLACLFVLTGNVFGAGIPSVTEREVLVRTVTLWDAGCSGSARSTWDDMVRGWYNEIVNPLPFPLGQFTDAWIPGGFYQNGTIVDSDFTDSTLVSWGNDAADDRLDSADVCMLAFHGGENTGGDLRWRGSVRVDEAGTGNCTSYQGHMLLGNLDLDFLHLSSCHSMCEDVWSLWGDSFDGLHQVDGFHGLMWIDASFASWYRDFADDAFDVPISEAWYDNMYQPNISGTDDQCPVARGVGSSQTDLWDRMDNEEYDYVYSDPSSSSWNGWIWIGGCNPDSDPALPN